MSSQQERTHSPQTDLQRRAARADAEIIRLEHMATHEGVLRSHKDRVSPTL